MMDKTYSVNYSVREHGSLGGTKNVDVTAPQGSSWEEIRQAAVPYILTKEGIPVTYHINAIREDNYKLVER